MHGAAEKKKCKSVVFREAEAAMGWSCPLTSTECQG